MTKHVLVIGAGPAGLMAADAIARQGIDVTIADAKPSFGRKFLMAGKSGLNLTKAEPLNEFVRNYDTPYIANIVDAFGPNDVCDWANGLGADVFIGSSGRVFPKVMKASPLLRAWIGALDALGVQRKANHRWIGFTQNTAHFETPNGAIDITADAIVLATGGASWSKLGSDGEWTKCVSADNLVPFAPSNSAVHIEWSPHMAKFMGHPVKAISITSGDKISHGEVILSSKGIEGGGIYPLSAGIRDTGSVTFDLCPDWTLERVVTALSRPIGKNSLSNHIRKTLGLTPIKIALLREFAGHLPNDPVQLATLVKALPRHNVTLRPIDEAISTVGGIAWASLTEGLMLRNRPGVFCAGEMIDWDAPTGGYLLTACLASGRWVGRHVVDYLKIPHRAERDAGS